jgi:hypothetical protein
MRKRKGENERLNDGKWKKRTRFNFWVLLEEMDSKNKL